MTITFLTTHKWTSPKRRPSGMFGAWQKRTSDQQLLARRHYCIKCGAVQYRFNVTPYSNTHWRVFFRAWGDIYREVKHIPPCPGRGQFETPIGA